MLILLIKKDKVFIVLWENKRLKIILEKMILKLIMKIKKLLKKLKNIFLIIIILIIKIIIIY